MSLHHPEPTVPEWHWIPRLDIYNHFAENCPCGAWEDVPGSVIHNSFDGREDYETGKRKRH